MDLKILAVKDLAAVLARAAKVAPRKSALPILSTVKVAVDYVDLVIEATDLEIAYRAHVPHANGPDAVFASVCVDARALRDAVAANKRGGFVTLESDGARLVIRGDAGETVLDGLSADDYPVIPGAFGDGWEEWAMPARELESALTATVFATLADDSRPVLQFVNASRQSDGRVRFVGCDGFRMGYAFTGVPVGPEFPDGQGIGIHRKAAAVFADIARGYGGVSASLCRCTADGETKRMAIQAAGETVLWTPPAFGLYPDVDRIIPRERANVIMAADQFAAAAARAKRAGAVHLAIEIGGAAATLTAGGNDVKQASTCPAEPIGDVCEPLSVALAPRYAAEAAGVGKGGDLYWLIQDTGKPARYDLPDKSAGGVIMPMNVAA